MLVSVVMAVYNGERYLEESVNSVLAQTYSNIELIIVDDGSTDSTKSILRKINDKRVKIISLNKNKGAATALNTGIMNAEGSWIAINDADDISYPTRIEEQVKYIQRNPRLVGVGTLVKYVSDNPKISKKKLKLWERRNNHFKGRDEIRKQMIYGSPVIHSSMMFSKDVFFEVGGYSSKYKITYDHDLWLKLLEKGDLEKVPKILLNYHVNKNSLAHKNYYKTSNEIQLTSSKAIYRKMKKRGNTNVIIAGYKSVCENYKTFISHKSGLSVNGVIDVEKDWKKEVYVAMDKVKKGEIVAVIVIGGDETKELFEYVQKKGLQLNKNLFNIFSIEPNEKYL